MKKFLFILVIFALCFLPVSCPNDNLDDDLGGQQGGQGSEGNENGDDQKGDNSIVHKEGLRIYIVENKFMVDGKEIWMNGVNTPWQGDGGAGWNNFGGTATGSGNLWTGALHNNTWWDGEFGKLKEAGINATRVWINCNNANNAILFSNTATGMISGASAEHWRDVDLLFNLAVKHEIYIMATLLSFDHFESYTDEAKTQSNPQKERWHAMIKSDLASKSFVDNYTIPFVNRYKDNPWLWSIDIMNEPDWLYESENIPWDNISYFLALNAAAIRKNSDILVTVGMASGKYNGGDGGQTNAVSDSYLQGRYTQRSITPDPEAKLDFWSPHYYDWVGEWYNVPFYRTPNQWGMGNVKPAVVGECSAKGIGNNWSNKYTANSSIVINNVLNDYQFAYNNGWRGVMAWTSNGVDGQGNLTNLKSATLNMLEKYPELIFPLK